MIKHIKNNCRATNGIKLLYGIFMELFFRVGMISLIKKTNNYRNYIKKDELF